MVTLVIYGPQFVDILHFSNTVPDCHWAWKSWFGECEGYPEFDFAHQNYVSYVNKLRGVAIQY